MRLPTRIIVVAGLVGLAVAIAVIRIQPSSSEATAADAGESMIDSKKAPDVNATKRGYTIDLNLAPEVIEFEGLVNYGSPITQTVTGAEGQPHEVHLKD